jgi:hypothetical protein
MQGHVIGALENPDTLCTKLHKLATDLGVPTIKTLGFEIKEPSCRKTLSLTKLPLTNHMSASPG